MQTLLAEHDDMGSRAPAAGSRSDRKSSWIDNDDIEYPHGRRIRFLGLRYSIWPALCVQAARGQAICRWPSTRSRRRTHSWHARHLTWHSTSARTTPGIVPTAALPASGALAVPSPCRAGAGSCHPLRGGQPAGSNPGPPPVDGPALGLEPRSAPGQPASFGTRTPVRARSAGQLWDSNPGPRPVSRQPTGSNPHARCVEGSGGEGYLRRSKRWTGRS
jgi:hypothetical protein